MVEIINLKFEIYAKLEIIEYFKYSLEINYFNLIKNIYIYLKKIKETQDFLF